ncbi:hypothetical protein BGZ50_001461, partial [Haplosporangium sp. Z 11]
MIAVGGLWMDPAMAALSQALAMEPLTGNTVEIYTDGSLKDKGTNMVRMACSSVRSRLRQRRALAGRVDGYASSTKPELYGLISAIATVDPRQDIHVYLDNKGVVSQFNKLVTQRHSLTRRQRLRCHFHREWAVVHALVQRRAGQTMVSWIKGHDGNMENDIADLVAKAAQERDTPPWQLDVSVQDDITFQVHQGGRIV